MWLYVSVHISMCVLTCEYGIYLCGISMCVYGICECMFTCEYGICYVVKVLVYVCVCMSVHLQKPKEDVRYFALFFSALFL